MFLPRNIYTTCHKGFYPQRTNKFLVKMQRVLSAEIGKSTMESSEYITKRLCCSIILTVTFFGLIGGFFLGKFVSEKATSHYETDFLDLTGRVETLNTNFQNTFHYNNGTKANLDDIQFLKCNFSAIGYNETGRLTTSNYLSMLNSCFGIG
ncbi:uncharacterized protein LOC114333855 [Diabrotica virgifera virgifera]|uniref:Uncharacterized protein LOC114333855 n=1 Tax=Diabrotica virgifera virgifera TaxID=50390 RepID=A0A6P7G553_DIAVI|nr:uncharacterized protein LOC114333855 [Diabrotica virgifera virgifera]